MIICVLLYAGLSRAQEFNVPQDSSLISIELPERHYFGFVSGDTILQDEPSYRAFFHFVPPGELPAISFEEQELVGHYQCTYCLVCPEEFQQCHRNACSAKVWWFLRPRPL